LPVIEERIVTPQIIAVYCFAIISIIILLFAIMVLWKIFNNDIDLRGLLTESGPHGKASLSRFQFLIFTFVIAGLLLLLSIEAGTFVDIPPNVLALLVISGISYLVSKAIPAQK
jgi:hypothetical protein